MLNDPTCWMAVALAASAEIAADGEGRPAHAAAIRIVTSKMHARIDSAGCGVNLIVGP